MKESGFLKSVLKFLRIYSNTYCLAVFSMVPIFAFMGAFSIENIDLKNTGEVMSSYGINSSSVQSIDLLQAPLNPSYNYSTGGAKIEIVDSSALLASKNPSGAGVSRIENKTDQIRIYVVRRGDSLSQIAEMFGVSVNTIVWSNDIKHNSLIKEGQKLTILPISGIRYTVKSGDSLSKIVDKYEGDLEEVINFNNISNEKDISIGEVVIIPNGHVSTPTKYTEKSSVAKVQGSVSYENGYFIRPVRNSVISQRLHGYNAIDFAAPFGTPVLASASGEVIISKDSGAWNGGYGNYIVIKHGNGTQTLYSHNSSHTVYVGQGVVKGQIIGYVGSTGRSTGPHVHFEVRGARNPFAY